MGLHNAYSLFSVFLTKTKDPRVLSVIRARAEEAAVRVNAELMPFLDEHRALFAPSRGIVSVPAPSDAGGRGRARL